MDEKSENFSPNSGAFILEQLQRFGSDTSRKHGMTFWLYFPTKTLAKQAAKEAEQAGLNPEVSPPLTEIPNSEWLCLPYCLHIPDEDILDGISRFCTDLAGKFNGNFDGWETKMELDDDEFPSLPFDEVSI